MPGSIEKLTPSEKNHKQTTQEKRRQEMINYFDNILKLVKQDNLSIQDFNELLQWAVKNGIIEQVTDEKRLDILKRRQEKDGLLRVIRGVGEKLTFYTLITHGKLDRQSFKGYLFDFLPRLRIKALQTEKDKQQKTQPRVSSSLQRKITQLTGQKKIIPKKTKRPPKKRKGLAPVEGEGWEEQLTRVREKLEK